jgi:SAM-dependent methyltransferase
VDRRRLLFPLRAARWAAARAAERIGLGPSPTVATTRYGDSFRVVPPPRPVAGAWPEPPDVEAPTIALEGTADPEPPRAYTLDLFEQLNAEYASKPIVKDAPRYDTASVAERSRRRLAGIHGRIGLAGRTVLEIGCGSGFEVWYLGNHMGADAWGVDIVARHGWSQLEGPRVHLIAADIAASTELPSDTFDRVLSFTVWEHIEHPRGALRQLARVMRPGGIAWIRANLYRGPTASHRSRHIHFPYPHLLFTDDVIAEAMRRAGRPAVGAAWVNKLTWEQYDDAFQEAGFRIKAAWFDAVPIDDAFYARFEDRLGRYPRRDLERSFFTAILEKPRLRSPLRRR